MYTYRVRGSTHDTTTRRRRTHERTAHRTPMRIITLDYTSQRPRLRSDGLRSSSVTYSVTSLADIPGIASYDDPTATFKNQR